MSQNYLNYMHSIIFTKYSEKRSSKIQEEEQKLVRFLIYCKTKGKDKKNKVQQNFYNALH